MECPVCKIEFDEKTGRRPKKFCSDPCKVKFWNAAKKPTTPQIQDCNQNTNQVPNLSKEPPKSNYVTPERHRLWKENDPREGSNGFYLKYECWNYQELEELKKH